MLVRGAYGLQEMAEGDERSACCAWPTFYSAEHDNFYCGRCRKGQGNEYHARNVSKANGPASAVSADSNGTTPERREKDTNG